VNRVVLDASAIIAAIGSEPGADIVLEQISNAAVSTVNLAEVKSKLVDSGFPPADAWEAAVSFSREIFDFDSRQADVAGGLISSTRHLGLSLGDRSCLALALILKAPVYTADRDWTKLDLGLDIRLVR
jgi:PIN domain nuclease of toxin-antitoxin system